MNLADKLTADSVEHSNETTVTACDDEVIQRQCPRLEYTVHMYGVTKGLNLL